LKEKREVVLTKKRKKDLQRAIVALIETPVLFNWDPQEAHVFEDRQACLDCTL
jgi:hypothetical protein